MQLGTIKDVDREILSNMSDRELLTVCQIDKRFYYNVCDDNFLRRRLSKYPGIEKYKREDQTWKQFFLNAIYYIAKIKEDFEFDYSFGDFNKQFILLEKYRDMDMLFFQSSFEGELSLVIYALKNGADIHFRDYQVLGISSSSGYLDIVKYLIESGIDVHVGSDYALRIASENGHLEVVKYLVEKGANIHEYKDNSLLMAAARGHLPVVKYLIEKGAYIHSEGDLPVKVAHMNRHLDVVKYLIEQGAKL